MSQAQNLLTNQLTLQGSLIELSPLRHTPGGVPVLNFRIGHTSEQIEADLPRKVEVELAAVALGRMAMVLKGAQIGEQIRVNGFLAAKSAESKQPVLHVNTIEFVEGMNHGI